MVLPTLPTTFQRIIVDKPLTAEIYTRTSVLYALVIIVGSPLIGLACDKIGRRAILILCCIAGTSGISILIQANNVLELTASRSLTAISQLSTVAVQAMLSDCSSPRGRALTFGRLNACISLGFILGSALTGLIGLFDANGSTIYLSATLFSVLAVLVSIIQYIFKPLRGNAKQKLYSGPDLKNIIEIARIYWRPLLLIFMFNVVNVGIIGIWPLYLAIRFGWGPSHSGMTIFLLAIIAVLSQLVLLPGLQKRITKTLIIRFACYQTGVTLIIMSFAAEPWFFVFFACLNLIGPMGLPLLQAKVSIEAPFELQGSLVGIYGLITGLAVVLTTSFIGFTISTVIQNQSLPNGLMGFPFAFIGIIFLSLGYSLNLKNAPNL